MSLNSIKINTNDTNYTHSIFDISEYTRRQYDDLSSALADVPTEKQSGGMTIRYIQTSDNKYVQFRLTSNTFTTTASEWQKQGAEVTVSQNTNTGGQNLNIGENKIANIDNYININELLNINAAFSGLGYPITQIPNAKRCLGLKVTYLTTDGWHIAQFVGTSLDNFTDVSYWEDALSNDIANVSKSLPNANLGLFHVVSKTSGTYMVSGTKYNGTNTQSAYLNKNGEVVTGSFPHSIITDYYRPTGDRDIQFVRLNKLFKLQNSSALNPGSINVALYNSNKKFVCGYLLGESCIIAVPRNYYLRTSHLSMDDNFDDVAYYDVVLGATEKGFQQIEQQLTNLNNTIIPFFNIYNDVPLVSVNEGEYIGDVGIVRDDVEYEYIIYDVTGLTNVELFIGKNRMWGAPIWTTFSNLNDGHIDSSYKVRNHIGTEQDAGNPYSETITFQSNEKYLVIANRIEEMTQYGYSVKYFNGYYSGKTAQEIEDELDSLVADIDTTINNKNIVLLGDSITWQGGVDCTEAKGWSYWFKNRIKPNSIKSFAWSGATWSNDVNTAVNDNPLLSLDDDNTIWQQVRKLIAAYNNNTQVKPDVIIIAAGINDVIAIGRGERIGCLDKTAAQAFADRTAYITNASVGTILTVADAIRYAFELLLQTFPDVQIILTTPLQASDSGVNQENWNKIVTIIKECGTYISANVIDQGNDCGIYYTQEYIGHYNLSDGLHPNSTGAKKIGNILAAKLRSMI